jgi:Ca-activated chloride channel family protein
MSLNSVTSVLHAVKVSKQGAGRYTVALTNKSEIPNRDFILKWVPAGTGVTEGVIANDGTFCITIVPPRADVEQFASPREVVFVMDQSGSQSGFPIQKSKELTLAMIDKLRPGDLFNVVTFNTSVNHLWPESMPNTPAMVRQAKQFVEGLQTGGGTNFLPPLTATMTHKPLDGRLKLIVFNTYGFVGDDFDILQMVQNNRLNARLFTFGIGNSVNRFLIDGMSAEGRGASEIVTLADDVSPAIARFLKRTQTPVLTDVQLRFSGPPVFDVTPGVAPDLFSDSPLVVFGRYEKPGQLKVTVGGSLAGRPWSRTIDIDLPAGNTGSTGVTKMWARKRLDDMVREDWMSAARMTRNGGSHTPDDSRFVEFALQHGIMSQWTSFVAVEKRVVNIGGRQRLVRVPIEMADGVSYEGIFGQADATKSLGIAYMRGGAGGGGTTGGTGGGGFATGRPRQGFMPPGITRITYDPTDNSLIVLGDAPSKVDKALKDKTGTLEVAVLVVDWPEDWVKTLTEAGLTIDATITELKVVYGRIDAKKLEELAKAKFVLKIRAIED